MKNYYKESGDERNIVHTIKRRKANWSGHILCRNCFLKLVIKGKVEGAGRRGIRCKQLLGEFKETRRYWKLEAEAPYRTLWRTGFGRGYRPVVRRTGWWWWWW
jgi:hypothetical protein